jgi:hypothetical protein
MRIFASTPRRASARAWWSACSCTPPQNDHEYGTTIPTFTGGTLLGPARWVNASGRYERPLAAGVPMRSRR